MRLPRQLAIPISRTPLSDLEFLTARQNRTLAPRLVPWVVTLACALIVVIPVAAQAGWPEHPV